MDLAGVREHAREPLTVQRLKQSRRATWGPTVGTHLDTAELDETFLKKAADLASRRPAAATTTTTMTTTMATSPSPASYLARERPATARRVHAPEDQPVVRTDSHSGHTLLKRQSAGTMDKRRSFASAGVLKNPTHFLNVRRWDARARTTDHWDGLQRDPELFNPAGELLVHLHARGHSRRGPSFRVSLHCVHKMRCGPMFTLCFADETSDSRTRRMPGAPRIYEIFIPSPEGMMREDAFGWHLTTRNFFAFLSGKPLVATNLGKAYIDLLERSKKFRAEDVDALGDIMDYMRNMGYLNFGHRPDYALAALYFAEHIEHRDLWIDAFAHCVGMNRIVIYSPEYQYIRRRTKTILSHASMEMDLHLARSAKAMSNFLEDELSTSHLGLSAGARSHLDRFRSFLQQYYVEKFGYWPPRQQTKFPKAAYKSMYFDFCGLYDYLVDETSAEPLQSQKPASGGICVLQNVQAFDRRHQYTPLPHSLPLIPDSTTHIKVPSQRSLLAFALASRSSRANRQYSARLALHTATNTANLAVVNAPLVKAYRQFERDCANARKEEKVSIADARKVRWILIYCILQTLISVTRAPKEVKDAERPEYPLCCTSTCVPPWEDDIETIASPISPVTTQLPEFPRPATSSSQTMDANGMPTMSGALSRQPSIEIHPDCETDAGFLGKSRSNSNQSLSSLLQTTEGLTATNSSASAPNLLRRNSSKASQRSIKTLSFANFGNRRNSVVKPTPSSFCEIIVHGYGNGLNPPIVSAPSSTASKQPVSPKTSHGLLQTVNSPSRISLAMPTQARPRPKSSYNTSNNSSTSTILAPQPIRPMSAHEKKSFRLPTNFTLLDKEVTSEELRTPTLEITQVERLNDRMNKSSQYSAIAKDTVPASSDSYTPVSASDTTDSDHEASPVWSLRRGSASSQSSVELSLKVNKATNLEKGPIVDQYAVNAELQDVGGLLRPTEASDPAILVHRTFSVERFRGSTRNGPSTLTPPNTQAVRRVRDQAFAAAQKWKRKSFGYRDDLDFKTILKAGSTESTTA